MTMLALWDWRSFWIGAGVAVVLVLLLLGAACIGFNLNEPKGKR